jgi:hypothetical protein
LRFNETSEDLRIRLGNPAGPILEEILLEAQAAYDEARDRADSAEQRAATIQGSVAIAASLTFAGGSLLLGSSTVPSQTWRAALGAGFVITVFLLAMAAWRAFLVTRPRFMWASPAAVDVVDHAHEDAVDAIRLRRASDLLVAYGRNDSIAATKIALLGQAVRWLLRALALIAILAALVAAYAIERSVDPKSANASKTSLRRGSPATSNSAHRR